MWRLKRKKTYILRESGFTLIELIVVLAGLGILSSLVLPNFIDLLDSNNVDEIKSLLNSAAADCLQKKRSELDPIVDDEIISDPIIEAVGYKIDKTNSILNDANKKPKCSLLLLNPISGDNKDRIRYNIGFQLLGNGKLDKLASTDMEKKKPDCIKWAGKCEFSEDAKILEDYKNEIRAAKKSCDSKFTAWENNNMSPVEFKRWDSTKGPDTCPLSPPGGGNTSYKGLPSCTTAGCTKEVWGLWDRNTETGSTYNSFTAYKTAFDKLFDVNCRNQIEDEYKNYTNPSSTGVRLTKCRNEDLFWFVEGNDKGSSDEWKKEMCAINKQKLLSTTHSETVEHCGTSKIYICGGKEILGETPKANFEACKANDKNARCTTALNNDALGKKGGPHTSPTPNDMKAPIGNDCNVQYWYCIDKIHRSKEDYDGDKRCDNKPEPTPQECNRPSRFCDKQKNYNDSDCRTYSTCMGRI